MELNKTLDLILNYMQSDAMYIQSLDIDEIDELRSYFYDYSIDFLSLLDEGISMGLDSLDIESIVSSLSDRLKFNLVKHFIEEYDNEEDLNRSLAYYYIQYLFMLNLTDTLLIEAYKDIVVTCKGIRESLLESQEIDILAILKKAKFKLPLNVSPKVNLEFNKGYLLSFIHNKLNYDEQFNLLSILSGYTNDNWKDLFMALYNNHIGVRDTLWFNY